MGIAEDKIAALFERFTQADASTTRVYGGTGLGLAICQRLMTMMGGKIGATSTPGRGSTFWFELPLPRASGAEVAAAPTIETAPLGARILVADDAPANRDLLSIILENMGFEVDLVCDGAAAVSALQTKTYDLVLMDVQMPVMDGFEATRTIRQSGRPEAAIPIIALTANVQDDHVAHCLATGMDGHVGKPVQIKDLARTIGAALQDAPSLAERAQALP